MSVSKATATRRAANRALRVVEIDLQRARDAGTSVASLLGAPNDARFESWRRGIDFAMERVRAVKAEVRA